LASGLSLLGAACDAESSLKDIGSPSGEAGNDLALILYGIDDVF
jgi:hypothetical protein